MPPTASLKPPLLTALRPSRHPRAFPANSCTAAAPVTAGGRPGNRGPVLRGRALSTEAIFAVQALKRAAKNGLSGEFRRVAVSTAARLLKADLLAVLAELRRQGWHRLALEAFVGVRRDFWPEPDLALSRHGLGHGGSPGGEGKKRRGFLGGYERDDQGFESFDRGRKGRNGGNGGRNLCRNEKEKALGSQ